MNQLQNCNFMIDSDFEKMMPLFSGQEYETLEHQIVYSGIPPAIAVWNKRIVKGLTEYKICRTWNIPFSLTEKNDYSYTEIIIWMCLESIKTNALSKKQLKYCIGRLYEAEKKLLAKKMSEGTLSASYPKDPCTNKNSSRTYTANLLQDFCPLSPGTVYVYGIYAASVDEIDKKIPGLAKELLTGEFQIYCKDTVRLCKFSAEEIALIHKKITKENDRSFLHSTEKCRMELARQAALTKQNKKEPDIKKMPPYDPDAEISSLTLTIPMWMNAIKRAQSSSGFFEASSLAFDGLNRQLHLLEQQIHILQKKIEEKYHA